MYTLESLSALNNTEATESGAPLSVFSVPSVASVVQHPYIYVGQLERTVYDAAGLAKFDEMVQRGELEVVYENGRVKIYLVRG